MRYVARFIDLATFDPDHFAFNRERLLARILLDIAIAAMWKVALIAVAYLS